jgi:hypothetical protein
MCITGALMLIACVLGLEFAAKRLLPGARVQRIARDANAKGE